MSFITRRFIAITLFAWTIATTTTTTNAFLSPSESSNILQSNLRRTKSSSGSSTSSIPPPQHTHNTATTTTTTAAIIPPSSTIRGGQIQISALKAWPLSKDPKGMSPDFPIDIARITITIACTFLTWYAQVQQRQYTNVMASSALTLICSMCFDKRLGQAAFCGSFAGMGSIALVPSWKYALLLGALTSALFEVLMHQKNYFLGIGGRLGATAFIASSIVSLVQGIPTGLPTSFPSLTSSSLSSMITVLASSAVSSRSVLLSMAVWHAVGSVATIALREASDNNQAADPVRASAVIGLIAALLLEDKSAALAVYGGSFVGMSLPSRLMHGMLPGKVKEGTVIPTASVASLLTAFAIAGVLGGIVHGMTINLGWWAGGWGGKAGFCGFVGCLLYRGMRKAKESIF